MNYLLITESPAKAKKIQGFLPSNYTVKSSCGHIIDLEKKKLSIDVDNDFKPTYKILYDKKDIVKMLKQQAKDKHVIYAADDDREGEAIAWHCANTLKSNLQDNNRIIFREISKKAILKSLEQPKTINLQEVHAQQARRLIDRLIGFKLSPCLWKHIDTKEIGLSAGRVQSALLHLVQLRESYIKNYDTDIILDIQGEFEDLKQSEFIFNKEYDINDEFIMNLFTLFTKDKTFHVSKSSKSKDKSYPKKPFITSSLQQSAQNEIGLPVKMTMDIAQKLYEGGYITYMRTDSTFISEDFQTSLDSHISKEFGPSYYQKPKEKKIKGAQEAHEAIRPTNIYKDISDLNQHELKLYNFILKRTITSHMKPAEYDVYQIHLSNELTNDIGYFLSKYRQLLFPGYLKFSNSSIEINDKPSFKPSYNLEECHSIEKEGPLPSEYNESAIVNLLEETGIGRPSTYATIISTLGNRKYTIHKDIKQPQKQENHIILTKNNEIQIKSKSIPGKLLKQRILITPLGKQVLTYLQTNFMNILDKNFTCQVEKDLDLIADGKIYYIDVIRKVYDSFIEIVDRQMNHSKHKLLGTKQNKQIFICKGPYGPYLQIINSKQNIKNVNVSYELKKSNKTLESFTFEDAIHFLKHKK
jgi:DNA topoisomerase I